MPYILMAVVAFAGWQWFAANGHKAKAALVQMQLLEAQGDLAIQTANNSILRSQVLAANNAVEEARKEGEKKRAEALRARDEALKNLEKTEERYEKLAKDWPQDCGSAVARIREEYGI
jgi:thymidylate kinase